MDIIRNNKGQIDWTNEHNRKTFKEMYMNPKCTTQQIADFYGLKNQTNISRYARNMGLGPKPVIRLNVKDENVVKFIKVSVDQGMKREEIALALNTSVCALDSACSRYKIKLTKEYDKTLYHQCTVCKKILPRTDFYKNNTQVTGITSRCKKCTSETRREAKLKKKFQDIIK